ncbi:MAG TPA: sodium-dependent transporter [Bacteroidales bacterium]|nr:MAG: Sodium:neurotransmitter symporter family protein [Bacteroidetes bacterium ADurb.Bin037]HPV88646.1 sodium-dependent transporter [Bacteroidales bacterium]HPW78048.1 sodium-dependent transporter [Bacteroidales bacterium]HQB55260.1 sodium-dependent transporter [Bacteroidales bacterium]
MKRDEFSGFFGVLVAAVGSAVGLGNLWRFPYLVGQNGGAAFILIYLAFVMIICLPIIISEFIIGRRSRANTVKAFQILAPNTPWSIIGVVGVLASFCIMAFYTVVGGWTLDYLFRSLIHLFSKPDISSLESQFTNLVTSPVRPILWTVVFMIFNAFIVMSGVKKGIEKYSKIMMPVLFLMIVILMIQSFTLPGAAKGVEFLVKPDFSKINTQVVLAALGQAFFSLSLGMGCMITYGSYIPSRENLSKLSFTTAISDTLFAILAGLAIMPAVFAFGISPQEGPGLVFIVLPRIFAQIPLGNLFAVIFFIILFIAAITSVISLLEVITAYVTERLKMKRTIAVLLISLMVTVCASFSSLSQGVLKEVKLFGRTIFDFFDHLSANILLPLGGLFIVLFVGWYMKKSQVYDEFTNQGTLKGTLFGAFYFIIRYVAPVAIAAVFLDLILR